MQGSTLTLVVVLLGVVCAAAASPPVRVVPVYEETRSPYSSTDSYSCSISQSEISSFETLTGSAVRDCDRRVSYSWTSNKLPTTAQRQQLCNCTDLIEKLQDVTVPRCWMKVDNDMVISYARLYSYAFELCDAPRTWTPRTSAPAKTRYTSSNDDYGYSSGSDTELIGGIIGGSVVCLLLGGFLVYKWVQRRRRLREGDEMGHDPNDVEDVDAGHGEGFPLSPVDGAPKSLGFPYAAEPAPATNTSSNTSGSSRSWGFRPTVEPTGSSHKTSSTFKSSTGSGSFQGYGMPVATVHMWDDPVITAKRVPREMISFGSLLASGGYGEVYKGTFDGETVAIKQLLPARRNDLTQIDAFMGEIKLMSQLDHERIVRFIGVAWNSLSDACAVVEYMENGDLRSVLTRWDGECEGERRPQGFDSDKIKIALHIAHALTYLHSLQPVVVHRDLKSKNILLNREYDAKLTDFGVSRERADSTMTAGVGSSLWMAPEVMMGDRYDEKADIFSFGVVLSELDSHQLPYSRAREMGTDTKLPSSVVLQMVALGKLTISFSEYADGDLVRLGYECVSMDPKKRPSAAEVLHRVHQVSQYPW